MPTKQNRRSRADDTAKNGEKGLEAAGEQRPTVNVFGAGIAGLTVAHELAERGFKVRVFEAKPALDRNGRSRIAVGGVARTQYAIAEPRPRADDDGWASRNSRSDRYDPVSKTAVAAVRDRGLVPIHVPFLRRKFGLPTGVKKREAETRLKKLLEFLRRNQENAGSRADVRITVTGYAHVYDDLTKKQGEPLPLTSPQEFHQLCLNRAQSVKRWLDDLIAEPKGASAGTGLLRHVEVTVVAARPGERAPSLSDGRVPEDNRWAVVDVAFTILPGEHGFRFFPSYYNHVFDTMRRIPLLDAEGNETGRTVYDNVMPTPNEGFVHGGVNPLIMPRSPPESAAEGGERLWMLRSVGYTSTDLVQFMLRTLRYMSTCSKRRAKELERISWWEYLQGYDPDTGNTLYSYSSKFESDIGTQARILASFDALWGDARTCGNTYLQLLYNWLRVQPKVDGTLNAPTTEAWFEPWQAYLERRLGVQFFPFVLDPLKPPEDGRIIPHGSFSYLGPELSEREKVLITEELAHAAHDADYHVIATDVCAAEALTEPLRTGPNPVAVGIPRELGGYTTRVRRAPPDDEDGEARTEVSPPGTPPLKRRYAFGLQKWDRLQIMSGIQYFFRRELKINDGYVYFGQAPWGLTSINSAQFWERRPTLERNGFVSLVTVDLAAWDTKAVKGAVAGKSMLECTAEQVAEEAWRQIVDEMQPADGPAFAPPRPDWFHIDECVRWSRPGVSTFIDVPYLVPIKADFHNRPGPPPWDPTPSATSVVVHVPGELGVWQAKHGGYPIHWGHPTKGGALVFAGVYLKTFTRMSTMEAANESGRHAANAILDHYVERRPEAAKGLSPARPPAPAAGDAVRETRSEETRHMRSEVFFHATSAGDYCSIWDMEHCELPELATAKQYDEWCFDRGLPHPWDVFGIERIPSFISKVVAGLGITLPTPPRYGPGVSIDTTIEDTLEAYVRMTYPWGGGEGLLEALRDIRRALDDALRSTGG